MEWFLGCLLVGVLVVVTVRIMFKSMAKEAVSLGQLEMSCIVIVADHYRQAGETLDEAIAHLPERLHIDMPDATREKVVAECATERRRYVFPFFFGGG